MAQKVLIALLLATIPPISSILHPVKILRVRVAPMLSGVREATNATTRQLEPAGTCRRDLPCLLSVRRLQRHGQLPMSFARHVPGSDLTPTELELASSLERNRMHGSSTESLGPAFPRVSRSPAIYARNGSALSPVHEQSTDMMLDSRGMVLYAPPSTSLVAPQQRSRIRGDST